MRSRVTLRERPLLDVFDLAVRFCIVHAKAYAKMSLVVLLPAFLVSWAAARFGNWWLGWGSCLVIASFASAPYVALASRLVFSDSVRTREALGIALRALPSLVGMRLLMLLALAASAITLFLAWLWIGSILLFVVEVIVLEQASVPATFGRSQRIASTHLGPATGTLLVMLVAPVCAAMLADVAGREVLQTVLEIHPPESLFHAGGNWLALAGFWLSLPLLSTARFFTYLDVRTRTEGWDIQTRFAGIAARAEAEPLERRAA